MGTGERSPNSGHEQQRLRWAEVAIARERLHRLVDALPDEEVRTAERYLQYLADIGSDPLLRTIAEAPYDEEPESEEERTAVQEAREAYARGDVVTTEELRRELGI